MQLAAPCSTPLERHCCVAGHPQQPRHTITLYPPALIQAREVACSGAKVALGSRVKEQAEQTSGLHSSRGKQRNMLTLRGVQSGSAVNPWELTNRIKECKTPEQLQAVYQHWQGQMNNIHVCAMFVSLAKLSIAHGGQQEGATAWPSTQAHSNLSTPNPRRTPMPSHAPALMQGQHSQQQHFNGVSVHGFAQRRGSSPRVRPVDPLFTHTLLQHLSAIMHTLENRQVANCLWAAAKLGAVPSNAWMSRALNMARHTWSQTKPQQVSNIAYALALRPEWLDSLSSRARWLDEMFQVGIEHADRFKPQEMASFLWSAAHLHDDQRLPASPAVVTCLRGVLVTACRYAHTFNDQEVCNVLWAVGKLCGQPGLASCVISSPSPPALLPPPAPGMLQALLDQVQHKSSVMKPEGLSTVLVSLGRLGAELPPAWLNTLLHRTTHLLPHCKCQELSNVLLGMAYLGHQPSAAWTHAWQQCALHKVQGFSSQELANITWSLCRLEMGVSRQFMARLLMAVAAKLHTFSSGELVMLMLGLARGSTVPDQCWMQLYLSTVHDQLESFSVQELSLILTCTARMGAQPPSHWLDAVTAHLLPHLQSMPAQSLGMTLHALAKLGYPVNPSWSRAFFGASKQQLTTANPQDLASMLWGAATLQMQPTQRWMAACLKRCQQLVTAQIQAQAAAGGQVDVYGGGKVAGQGGEQAQPRALLPRGGDLESRVKMVTGRQLWSAAMLDKVVWSLGRLGHASNPAGVALVQTASGLDVARRDWQAQWQQYLHVAHGGQSLQQQGPDAAEAAQTEATASHGHVGQLDSSAQHARGVLPADMDYLVLEGILDWSAAKLRTPASKHDTWVTPPRKASRDAGSSHVHQEPPAAEVVVGASTVVLV